ncbi:hypothetical protein SMAC4_13739 [Sordaria macrospora]|nr:hypothetical protein SMAC4_13739 [Sordaria macrospora]
MPSVLRSNQSVKTGASPVLRQTRSVSWAKKAVVPFKSIC